MKTFYYTKRSRSIIYHGQSLDSLLELKFILSIEQTHAWIRDGLQIYYNMDDHGLSSEESLQKYTPDILVRNWKTGTATLVEIKPDHYNDKWANRKRHEVAEKYIEQFGYDWQFKIIYERNISLTAEQQQKYRDICHAYAQTWFGSTHPNNTPLTNDEYTRYVTDGWLPAAVPRTGIVASHSCTSCSLLPATH